MNISRTYFLIIAIVGIFTGMIAPTVSTGEASFPYAMTNMQYVAYGIMASLVLLFLCVAFRWRYVSQILIGFVIIATISLGIMTVASIVKNFSGSQLVYFSWGWIFLIIGLIFLIFVFLKDEEDEYYPKTPFADYEKIIGITGAIVCAILSLFVIFVAEKNAAKSTHISNIEKIFAKNSSQLASGETLSSSFEKISNFSYDRKKNILSFVGTASGATMAYPIEKNISQPDNLLAIKSFAERNFFIQKTGEVIENGEWIGQTSMTDFSGDFLVFVAENGNIVLVTDSLFLEYEVYGNNPELFTYIENTGDLYWRVEIDGQHILYKNSKPITEFFPGILRYSVAENGDITMIAEDKNYHKMVVKNNTIIHTMFDNYVQGTLRMNTADVLYVIKNDDETFSLVLNGVVLDRKLHEIREIFIEQNTSGFAYFGRPLGDSQYCLFTRYRGNLCGIESYMNPSREADNAGVIFAGLRNNRWSIYRNTHELIRDSGYATRPDFSYDYFFFDATNPRRYVFIEKLSDGYYINKMWKIIQTPWKDIDVTTIGFGENNVMFMVVQDGDVWKILEF